MKALNDIAGYRYADAGLGCAHVYLLPKITEVIERHFSDSHSNRRLLDLGCGNGSVAAYFAEKGFEVIGIDPSADGVAQARAAYPHLRIEQGSAYDDLQASYGRFHSIISLEVVEHVYAPRDYIRTVYSLLEKNGIAVVSTPYHGYLKNIAIAVTNNFDKHVNPLWDHGHIKFWSMITLRHLLEEAGFTEISFYRVGRIPSLAKSMIAVAKKS